MLSDNGHGLVSEPEFFMHLLKGHKFGTFKNLQPTFLALEGIIQIN
jgi:hypothetical protein